MTEARGYLRRAVWAVLGVFWNRGERRLRALFRLGLAIVLFGVLTIAIGIGFQLFALRAAIAGALAGTIPDGAVSAVLRVVGLLLTALAAVLAIWVAGRFLDRRPFREFGFRFDRGWWLDLGFGLALGAGLMGGIFLVELAAGWISISGTVAGSFNGGFPVGVAVQLLVALVLFVAVGIYEELLFRGYLLTNAAEGLVGLPFIGPRSATALATLLTAGLFGVAHASNPNATLLSTLAIGFAGIFLAVGYLLTAELAIPIGLHITWNLFQGTVFGFPVSGTNVGASVVRLQQNGPTAFTGGSFGPEAGILGLGAMVLGIGLTIAWVRFRSDSVGIDRSLVEPTLRWHERKAAADSDGAESENPADGDSTGT